MTDPAERPRMRALDDYEVEAIDWVRPGWLARGKLTVLDGMPDVGKSTISADFAARATTGAAFPGGGEGFGSPVGVLLASSAEDGLGDTIRPRVMAAGGDPSLVQVLEGFEQGNGAMRPFSLPGDSAFLLRVIWEHAVGLVWLDSLMASLPADVNSHKDQEIRLALHPLASLAAESGAAVIFLRHPTKGGMGPAMYRGGGSVAIVGVARCALMAMKDPEDETGTQRLLAITKCNLVPESQKATIKYSIGPRIVEAGETNVSVGRVEWGGEDARRADGLLAAAERSGDQEERADAAAVMLEELTEAMWAGLGAEAMDAVRKAHDIGRHTWERERARLRRERRIVMEQPGKDDGSPGRDVVTYWLARFGPPAQSGGANSGGPRNPHGQGDPGQLPGSVPQAPRVGDPPHERRRCVRCGDPWPGAGSVCEPCLEEE